jgi:hypothetical protein
VSPEYLEIRELAAWGFDHPVDRGLLREKQLRISACHAQSRLAVRTPYPADPPISIEETRKQAGMLADRKNTVASSREFADLAWELAVVDLRKLIAFQRRIGFAYCGGRLKQRETESQQLIDRSLPLHPISKSPYMEVASYRGRWFLRDGYHRSFRLLNQSVSLVPCVVVYAESLVQMGAVGSQFFSQEILFSEHPPMVTDFLDEVITVRYRRELPEQAMPFTFQQVLEPVPVGWDEQEVL